MKRDTSYMNKSDKPPQPDVVLEPPADDAQGIEPSAQRDETLPEAQESAVQPQAEADAPEHDPYAPQPGTPAYRRMEISQRLRAQRDEENADAVESSAYDSLAPPMTRRAEAEEPEAAASAEEAKPEAPSNFLLNVNGKLYEADRAKLMALADVSEEEFEQFGVERVKRVAQINLAAQEKLEEAKAASRDARRSSRAGQDAADQGDQRGDEEQTGLEGQGADTSQTSEEDRRRDLIQKFQYGTEEEVDEAFSAMLDAKLAERSAKARQLREEDNIVSAFANFGRSNPDIASDELATRNLVELAVMEARQHVAELRGMTYEEASQKFPNAEVVGQELARAVVEGKQVKSPAQILEAAGEQVRQRLHIPRRQQPESQPSPQPTSGQPARPNRQAMKDAMPQTPQRASRPVPAPPAAPTGQKGVSDRIAAIRARTGRNF